MHYSNVESPSEKLGILAIFKKDGGNNDYTVVLSKSKHGTNENREFPMLVVTPDMQAQLTYAAYKGGDPNHHLGTKTPLCDLPDDMQELLKEKLLKK